MGSKELISVAGRRLLVVEDEYLIAMDLASWLEGKGAEVLGPAGSVEGALTLLQTDTLPDATVLDINLGNERVFPVADALQSAHVPFVFLSGYDTRLIPETYQNAPRCTKPLDRPSLLRALSSVLEH